MKKDSSAGGEADTQVAVGVNEAIPSLEDFTKLAGRVCQLRAGGFSDVEVAVTLRRSVDWLRRHFAYELDHGPVLHRARLLDGLNDAARMGDRTSARYLDKIVAALLVDVTPQSKIAEEEAGKVDRFAKMGIKETRVHEAKEAAQGWGGLLADRTYTGGSLN